jgi:di/tricarboxylate transporter
MTQPQIFILCILGLTVGMFLWGKWRHDMVAIAALLACVLTGLVPAAGAFHGFGHPAVITVACVLILSRSLQTSGAIDALTHRLIPKSAGPVASIAALSGLGAVLSAFMNNVGALALLMPVAIQMADRRSLPPGRVLMPLAFGSILGGMTTLIGTPPNLIVSGFRESTGAGSFAMFDFSPVGLAVAGIGLLFITLVGWRLVPPRERVGADGFDTGAYLTEARVTADGACAGKTLEDLGSRLRDLDCQIVGMLHNRFRVSPPHPQRPLQPGDILVIEAEPDTLATTLTTLGLKLEGDSLAQKAADAENETPESTDPAPKPPGTEDLTLMELAVRPGTSLVGRSATGLQLRTRYHISLLALSRRGKRSIRRLRSESLEAGDVLLMQGAPEAILGFAAEFGCVPLAQRAIRIPNPRQALAASLIMATAIVGAAFGLLPAAISFAGGVLAAMIFKVIPPRAVYEAVDWPVVVLLGALIPVAGAMETTDAAAVLAHLLMSTLAGGSPVIALAILLIVTMTLSDFMNNAATAAVMCPIAIGTAAQFAVRADPFLMAVAIGASCAFLTPIGHQNNTLILGPGGLRFGDFWKLGLPLEILVIATAIPLLLFFWPL